MTRLLDGLKDAGLVERTGSDADLRVAYAQLTEAGVAKHEVASRKYVHALRALFETALSAAEIAELGDLLARLPGVGDQADTPSLEAA